VTEPGPGQVYRGENGELLLYARRELREGVEGHVLVGVKAGVTYTRFYPTNTVIPAELVNDTAGRQEAAVERAVSQALEHELETLKACMKQAVKRLPESERQELRALYARRMEGHIKVVE